MQRTLVTCCLLAALAPAADAMFMMPQPVPIDRITTNLAKRVEDNPGDAEPHYRLGRAHDVAVWLKAERVAVVSASSVL